MTTLFQVWGCDVKLENTGNVNINILVYILPVTNKNKDHGKQTQQSQLKSDPNLNEAKSPYILKVQLKHGWNLEFYIIQLSWTAHVMDSNQLPLYQAEDTQVSFVEETDHQETGNMHTYTKHIL